MQEHGIKYEDIKCKVSFNLKIEIASGTEFTGRVAIDIPTGDITTSGRTNYDKKDFRDIIFKRS